MKKLKKKLKIRPCQKKADIEFSLYIRALYADKDGYCQCITCGKKLPWSGTGHLHVGHFIGREHIPTRYEVQNCHPQCDVCNSYHEGRKGHYALFLIKTYGQDIIEKLVAKSNEYAGLIPEDYLAIRDKYKQLSKDIIKNKGLV